MKFSSDSALSQQQEKYDSVDQEDKDIMETTLWTSFRNMETLRTCIHVNLDRRTGYVKVCSTM